MVNPMITKTEWLSLRLHSEEIYNLVSLLEVANTGIAQEASLALRLESQLISMRSLTQLLRGVIQMNPKTNTNLECRT